MKKVSFIAALLMGSCAQCMAQSPERIYQLPPANTPLSGSEQFVLDQAIGGQWKTRSLALSTLLSSDASSMTVLSGVVARSLASRFGETLDLLDYATTPGQGNGTVDDGPMFRAAIAACISGNGFRRLHVPQAQSVWLIGSLDASGLGALVFGNGTNPQSCWLDGDSIGTGPVTAPAGTRIMLANGVNRPLVYVQPATGSVIFSNLTLNGNSAGQSGWTGGALGKLWTVQVMVRKEPRAL